MNDPPEKTTICAGCASFLRANASTDAYNEPVEDSRWSKGHDGMMAYLLCNFEDGVR